MYPNPDLASAEEEKNSSKHCCFESCEDKQEDDEDLEPVPQLATQEALPLAGGGEEDSLGPERQEENVKTYNHGRKKRGAKAAM